MLLDQYADAVSKGGGIGIAAFLDKQTPRYE